MSSIDQNQQSPASTFGSVLSTGLLVYFTACVFFNIGFFLTVGLTDTFTMAVADLPSLLSQPLVPVAIYVIAALNAVIPFLIAGIILGTGVGVFEVFRRRRQNGNGGGLSRSLRIAAWLLALPAVLALFLVLGVASDPFIVLGGNDQKFLARCVGAMMAIGAFLYLGLSTPDRIIVPAYATYVALVVMLIALRVGTSMGALVLTHVPDRKIELANGYTAIGTPIMTVPSGVMFSEYLGPRERVAILYGNEQIVRIGPTPDAERKSDPKVVLSRKPLLCDFLQLWGAADLICPNPESAVAVLPSGHLAGFIPLSSSDPRAQQATSLSEFRVSVDPSEFKRTWPAAPKDSLGAPCEGSGQEPRTKSHQPSNGCDSLERGLQE